MKLDDSSECTTSGAARKGTEGQSNKSRFLDSLHVGVMVIGGAILVGLAGHNSLMWHLQRFWGVSGTFWQDCWQWWLNQPLFNGNDEVAGYTYLLVMSNLVYWGYNMFLFYIDFTGKPQFLAQFKIQETKNVPLDRTRFYHALKVVLINHFLLTNIFGVSIILHLIRWRGNSFGPETPTFQQIILDLIICILAEEVFFYYTHRLVHWGPLYRAIHKQHHEWTAPIGIISLYAHPIEHICSNLLPVAMGPLIAGNHIVSVTIWVCLALFSTSNAHSGYHFPGFPSSEAHDFHHLKFNSYYGVLGILDALHNTDKAFKASRQYQMNYTFFGTRPLREINQKSDQK